MLTLLFVLTSALAPAAEQAVEKQLVVSITAPEIDNGILSEITWDNGALLLVTGAQRLYEWKVGFTFPSLLTGTATVKESFNDALDRFEISVDIRNPLFGHIFGYRGFFDLDWKVVTAIPESVRPLREEARE